MIIITIPLWIASASGWAAWVGVHLACEAVRKVVRS